MAQDDFSLLVGAVERAESGGRRYDKAGNLLTSLKGAQGEMQVMPRTQRDPGFGVAPARQGSPEDIARVGRDYLKAMVDRYGNREHALVAYNWGPGNADKWIASGANPAKLPKETRDYVARVDRFMAQPQQAAVSRETKQQLDEAPARAMQETLERSPSAQAPVEPDVPRETKLAEMGQGYQAALALAVLADVDEEERKQRDVDDDREPSIAQKWLMEQGSRPTALAEFADVKIRSPFAEPQPVKMAEGGDVNAANSRLVSDLGDPDRWKYEAAASGPASSSSFGSILRLSQAALNNPQNTVRAGLALPVLPPNATAEQINEYNRQVSAMLGKPATVPEALMPDTSVKPPVADFPVVDAGGGNATTPGPSSSAPGQGISNTAAAAGLAAMGVPSPAAALGITSPVGQSVVNAISPIGAIAALGLNAMGSAVAGQQADAMGQAMAALDAANTASVNAPGIVSVSDQDGNVSTVATNDSIAAVDAAVAAAAAAANPANAASDAAEAAAIGSIGSATDDGTTAGIDAAAADAGSSSSTGDGGPDGAGFNEGGEVQEPNVFKVPLYSETVSYEMYPGQQGQFDQRDAARHMLAAGTLARKYGSTAAEMLGKLHEITTSPMRYLGSKLGISEMPVDYEQDLHNNRVGIELGKRSKSQKELEDLVQQMAEQAQKSRMEGKPWVGRPERPVKRKDGSPITGERADLTRPMTYNPMIRRQGEAARRLAAMRDVNTLPDPRTYAAVSGFLGAAPDELGFSVMHPDLAGIKAAGEKGFAAGTVAQVAPMAAALRGLGSGAKTTAQQMLAGMKDLPVGMAVKPRGGVFVPAEGETRLAQTLEGYQNAAKLQGLSPEAIDFLKTKAPKYFTSTYGTADDPLRTAFRERKIEPYGLDRNALPPYLVDAATNPQARGFEQARRDLETAYDMRTGISASALKPSESSLMMGDLRNKEIAKMTQEGVPQEFINAPYPDVFSREDIRKYPTSAKILSNLLGMRTEGTLPPHLSRALDTSEVMYDLRPALNILNPQEVAEAIAQIPPNKLKNMSFPDALIEGNKKLEPIRNYRTAIDMADRGARVPERALSMFTKPVMVADDKQWVQLTDALASEMEGSLMKHSVGGYSKGDSYNRAETGLPFGGKKAFDQDLVRLYSLRGPDGMPTTTVEIAKSDAGKGDAWNVIQIRGRFNSEPPDKEVVLNFLDKLDKDIGLNQIRRNSYIRSETGEAGPTSVINWGEEFNNWKAGTE